MREYIKHSKMTTLVWSIKSLSLLPTPARHFKSYTKKALPSPGYLSVFAVFIMITYHYCGAIFSQGASYYKIHPYINSEVFICIVKKEQTRLHAYFHLPLWFGPLLYESKIIKYSMCIHSTWRMELTVAAGTLPQLLVLHE